MNGIFSGWVGTSVWRRLYCGSIWEKLRFPVGEVNEDYPLLVPATVAAGGMVHVRARLYFYRPSPSSVTATYWKKDAGVLLRNLKKMYEQIQESCPGCMPAFRIFCIRGIYSLGVSLEKHAPKLGEDNRKVYMNCRKIMKKNWLFAMTGKTLPNKDKILYTMVATRTLYPVYKLFGKL